jgi:hypothetical protein
VETEIFVKSLRLYCLSFVKIDNLPLLGFGSIVTPNLNWVSFFILSSSDIEDFAVVPVDELVVLILEDLPPSRVSAPDLHVVGFSRALDIP